MNRLFCWLTGGHRYADNTLETEYVPYKGEHSMLIKNRCAKCGKEFIANFDIDKILYMDIVEFLRRRKDGADNE